MTSVAPNSSAPTARTWLIDFRLIVAAAPSARLTRPNDPPRAWPTRCCPSAVKPNRDRCGDHPPNWPNPPDGTPPSARRSKHGPHVSPIQPSDSGAPTAPQRHAAMYRSPPALPRTPSTASG
jgi:hypothetical protein